MYYITIFLLIKNSIVYLLGINRGERVVEGLDDVVSVPRAGNNGAKGWERVRENVTKMLRNQDK